ncbi:MAG: hypothetical protein GY953_35920, partial [bacterium]|nr:hypothetical protein [bacterium]
MIRLVFLIFLAAGAAAVHANWPQFRGPKGDGHAPPSVKNVPAEWSEEKNVAWKTAIPGRAWSSPAIWGDQVWVTNATEDGKKMSALCLNRASGKIVHDLLLFEN